jgi:PEGA domain
MFAALAMLAAVLLPFGGLYINSLPTGADVWIDGSYIGRTPLLIDGLRAGKHAVTITKAGWKVEEVDQQVTPGVITPASVQLDAVKAPEENGTLKLLGLHPTALVSFDEGPPQEVAPQYDVRAGTHHLVIREGETKFERYVIVFPGQTTHVLFRTPEDEHSAVVAPFDEYMPASAAKTSGNRVVIRWNGHVAQGHIGDARFLVDGRDVVYDAPAGLVRGRLYLPLDLILAITGGKSK